MTTVSGQHPEEHARSLREEVVDRLADVRSLRPDAPEYDEASEAVFAAAADLLEFEQRLPLLLDAGPHRVTVLVVRWSGILVGAVGLALGVAAVAGWLPVRWLFAVVGLVAVAFVVLRWPIPGPTRPHVRLRPGASAAAAGSLLVAIGAAGAVGHSPALERWVTLVGALLLLGGWAHLRRSTPARRPAPVVLHAPKEVHE